MWELLSISREFLFSILQQFLEYSKNNKLTQMEVVKEELLHCSICMELFTDPRGLPCQHTFCCHCLTTFINAKRDRSTCKSFDCPLCRRSTSLETASADGNSFPKNLIITSLLDIHKSRDGEHRDVLSDDMLHISHHVVDTKDSFTQTDITQCKESAAQTISKSRRNQKSQTNSTLVISTGVQTKVKITKRQKETQTDNVANSYVTNSNVLERRNRETQKKSVQPENAIIFVRLCLFFHDLGNSIFVRRQVDLFERVAILCVTYFHSDSFVENTCRLKRVTLKFIGLPMVRLYCIICLCFYSIFVLYLLVDNNNRYVFLIFLMYTFFHQVMTIEFRAHHQKARQLLNIVVFHAVWFCTTLLCFCLILYSVCLLINIRGHPVSRTICEFWVESEPQSINLETQCLNTAKQCRKEPLKYPDISFVIERTNESFNSHFTRIQNLDFSRIHSLVNEFYHHVIMGMAFDFFEEMHYNNGERVFYNSYKYFIPSK